jgi:hypothetical protein
MTAPAVKPVPRTVRLVDEVVDRTLGVTPFSV